MSGPQQRQRQGELPGRPPATLRHPFAHLVAPGDVHQGVADAHPLVAGAIPDRTSAEPSEPLEGEVNPAGDDVVRDRAEPIEGEGDFFLRDALPLVFRNQLLEPTRLGKDGLGEAGGSQEREQKKFNSLKYHAIEIRRETASES